ncbi:ferric uptake regulator family protein [Paraglaciecola polaris LMG 21857]|uniref:Ferric uptake regulator family protein n=2 Tax=Paraglaciecola polaris TaxID=222814 RepID=K6YQF9_9ALTE|nr:ferric uptake regulator family protein [Paraglaciecola polaris LMG 21857]
MSPECTNDFIEIARGVCEKAGSKLTETRQHMLEVLLDVSTPMSAYELTDHYNMLLACDIKTMSVYRVLDFLESIRLVHRLQSINKYIICNHTFGACEEHPPLFMICKSCQHIEEVEVDPEVIQALTHHANSADFSSVGSQIELYSLCIKCQSTFHKNLS